MGHTPERIALVTGASKGLGAEVAKRLASPDTHVIVNVDGNAARAASVAADIRNAGGHATTLAADISDGADTAAMIGTIAARFGRLDTLILHQSGGLEPGAERRLAQLAIPLMPAGGRIVFVTSHQAHFFPDKAVPKGFAAIAASQRASETALYTMRSEFVRAGVQFTVVSGNMTDDTFAAAVVNSANTLSPTGIVFVGGANYLMTA